MIILIFGVQVSIEKRRNAIVSFGSRTEVHLSCIIVYYSTVKSTTYFELFIY